MRARSFPRPHAVASAVGAPLRTAAPSPYNDKAHLGPRQFEDHDGGPWNDTPAVRPTFKAVPQKWVVAPALGSAAPAICVFPRRLSNNISFAPDVHLSFASVWTPIIARFTTLFLTDVDKKGSMPDKGQQQHWLCTFKGKTSTSLTSVVLRIRVNDSGDQIEGSAARIAPITTPHTHTHKARLRQHPCTDGLCIFLTRISSRRVLAPCALPSALLTPPSPTQSFIDFPAPPASQVGFDSSTAVVVNGAFTAYDPNQVEIIFSKLDESVERERRIERARQAWRLFSTDIKQRSAATMENVNFM